MVENKEKWEPCPQTNRPSVQSDNFRDFSLTYIDFMALNQSQESKAN